MAMLGFLLIATFLLVLYDFRHRLIPNWITLPIILVGTILHFPGVPEVWIGSFILILFGFLGSGRIGFGDVKLWLAFFWMLPLDVACAGVLTAFSTIFLTSLAQVLYLRLWKSSPSQSYPAAWRVFVTVLVVLIKSYIGLYYA